MSVLLAPALVWGQGPQESTVGAFPLKVSGNASDAARARLGDALEQGLERAGFEVVAPDDLVSAAGVEACGDDKCFVRAADAAGARYLMVASVELADRVYEIQTRLIDGSNGQTIAQANDSCELCGLEEAADLLANLASGARREIERLEEAAPPHLVVQSVPDGASVYIDGELAGETPLDIEVASGRHDIRVSARGYLSEDREIVMLPDVRQRLAFNLERDNYLLDALGWTGVAVGVAMVGSGSALLAFDEKPNRRQCDGDNVDPDGDCKFRYNTLGGGLALTLGGAVLLASVGVTALVLAKRKRKRAPKSARLLPGLGSLEVRF